MNNAQYTKLLERLAKDNQLAQPTESNVRRMQHYYQDLYAAMFRHMHNMVATYGEENVKQMLKDYLKQDE
jgi:hypothetical protein